MRRGEETDNFLNEIAHNVDFNEWIESLLDSDEINQEMESHIHFLRDITAQYIESDEPLE